MYLFMKAQNALPFSLECTKVKLLILNNFDFCTCFFFLIFCDENVGSLLKKLGLKSV